MNIPDSLKALTAIIMLSVIMFSAPATAQKTLKLSDAEVASVAVVANQIDIGYGEIAKTKSKNDDVLRFAETMIKDHTAVIEQAAALVKKLGVTPQDNAVSQKLLADAEKTKKKLLSTSASGFDKAYIDNELNITKP